MNTTHTRFDFDDLAPKDRYKLLIGTVIPRNKGIRPCIPGRKSRDKPVRHDKRRYKRRNRISSSAIGGPVDVLEGRSELAITDTRSALDNPQLEAETLGGGPVFFCHRLHPLAQRSAVEWEDVMRFPWALTLMQGRWLDLLPSDLGAAGRQDPLTGDLVPAICVDSFSVMVAAVRNDRKRDADHLLPLLI